jgi:hypothetical protein
VTLDNPGEADTLIDGYGVIPDTPIGIGTRIRFRLEESGQYDITAYVEDGVLHVAGQYRPLVTVVVEENHVDIVTKRW